MRTTDRKSDKLRRFNPDPYMTEDRLNELKKRLEKLKNDRPRAIKEMQAAAELGDFSENAEYQYTKAQLRGINHNIMKLEYQINHAIIIDPQKNTDIIDLGSTVTLDHNKNQIVFQILGSTQTNPTKKIISHKSPLGSALIGHKINDIVSVKVGEKKIEYKIIKIN